MDNEIKDYEYLKEHIMKISQFIAQDNTKEAMFYLGSLYRFCNDKEKKVKRSCD